MIARYLLFQKAEAALLEEKGDKLFGIARLLDAQLTSTFADMYREAGLGDQATRADKLAVLNRRLAPFCDAVAACFPGVAVGYHAADLDCIVCYGPSSDYGHTVGITLGPDHIGRRAMAHGREVVGVGSMVRGDIMNCVRPLLRDGKAIGFVWANETVEGIYQQTAERGRRIFFSPDIEPLLGLTGLMISASNSLFESRRLAELARAAGGSPGGSAADAGLIKRFEDFGAYVDRIGRYLRLFLHSLAIGTIVADPEGRVVFASRWLERRAGIRAESLQGLSLDEATARLGLSALAGRMRGEGGGFGVVDGRMVAAAGDEIEVTVIWSHLHGDSSEPTGTVVLIEDIERAKGEEERLRRSEKLSAVGELAASIAHEIRNPLTIINGSLQLLPDRLGDPQFLIDFARIAGSELGRVNSTVEALLNFARFSTPQMAPISLGDTLARTVDLMRAFAGRNNVTIREDYDAHLPTIRGDGEHLRQAFLNLMLNAIQAMPEGGVLTLKTAYVPGAHFVTASVADTGSGIKPEDQERIFNVFYSTKSGGTGLGLPLVHRIVDEHGGFIEFDSAPGQGTSFAIHLPVGAGIEGSVEP
ncbi:MAG: ATP-binding protein [Chloroflexota bacterium]